MRQTHRNRRDEFGFTLIELMIVIAIIGILIGAAVVTFRAAQKSGNESATQQDMRTIATVEIQYFTTHNRTYGTFEQMVQDKVLTTKFAGNPPLVDGYVFTLKVIPKSSTQAASYTLNADPQSDSTGRNHYYIDSNDTAIHMNPDQPAGPNDPPLGSG